MFSGRLPPAQGTNALAALLQRKRGTAVLDLTESNPTDAALQYEDERIRAALARAETLRYSPDARGLLSAREAVCVYYSERGIATSPERLLLSASTSEAYAWLFKLLCDPGDEVLIPRPSYPLFDWLAQLESVRLVQYSLFYDHGWHVDAAELERLATPRTRAVMVVNPNNPTGSFLKRHELSAVIEMCARHDLAVVSDEVFADYAFAADQRRAATVAETDEVLTFALSGLSKVAGLPQVKLGWMAVNGPPALLAEALARLELIADTYLSVSTPVQVAAPELLATAGGLQDQIRARTASNLRLLRSLVTGSTVDVLDVEGGWYAVARLPKIRTEEEWVLGLLAERDVLVQPGWFYDFETEPVAVLSLLTPESTFAAGVRRLLAYSSPDTTCA